MVLYNQKKTTKVKMEEGPRGCLITIAFTSSLTLSALWPTGDNRHAAPSQMNKSFGCTAWPDTWTGKCFRTNLNELSTPYRGYEKDLVNISKSEVDLAAVESASVHSNIQCLILLCTACMSSVAPNENAF